MSESETKNLAASSGSTIFKEIASWKLEAKLEDNSRYFRQIPEVNQIEDGSKCYVIGRKGTGKTAISEFILQNKSYNYFADKLSFKNFPFNDLYALKNDRFTHPNEYITIWKYIIYSSIAQMMSKNESINTELTDRLKEVYKETLANSLSRTISKWTSKAFSLNILGTGFNVSASNPPSPNNASWIDRVEILEDFIIENIDASSYYVIFDELDEDYTAIVDNDAKNHSYLALLIGLFKAVQDIKSIFPSQKYNILPVVFLRDDIYDLLTDSDKTKWSDLRIDINWNPEKIKDLLAFRISRALSPESTAMNFGPAWGLLFSNKEVSVGHLQLKSMNIFDYITRSTLRRPRDYIAYMRLCAEMSTNSENNITGLSP